MDETAIREFMQDHDIQRGTWAAQMVETAPWHGFIMGQGQYTGEGVVRRSQVLGVVREWVEDMKTRGYADTAALERRIRHA